MARYALVVGIPQYPSPLKNLEKTTADAEAVAQVLERYGGFAEVKRLPSRRNPETQKREMAAKALTGAELGEALRTLLLEQATNSEALIYFTGHGLTVSGNLGQASGYLGTSDCEIEVLGDRIVEQKRGIALNDLNELIVESELSSLVVLFDCCHSGHFLERNLLERTFSGFSSQKDYYLITACRSFQEAYALRSEERSVFTGALLKGLAAENADADRRISGDRLFDCISRELRGSQQEPLRLGWGSSLILVTHPPAIPAATHSLPPTPAVNRDNPYLGLQAFDTQEADYFFGREPAVRALLDLLKSGRFLAVIGPSGCGKSSLVKAGLLPELKRERLPGSSQWLVMSFTPGVRPLEALEKALAQPEPQDKSLLLFIDQFEEVFTLCEDEAQRREFIRRLREEVTNTHRLTRVIVAMRGDFLDRCAAYQEAAILINRTQPTTYFVTPLTPAQLEEVIEKPADKHGVKFEWGLVGEIIAEVADQPGALPLLQYALAELWRICVTASESPQPELTRKCYEEIRGVKGALENRASDLYGNLAPADKDFVRRLFLELVQLGEGQEVTRRRATWQELEAIADSPEQLQRVTRQLASQQQRLIVTDHNSIEVAHEALLSEWQLLRSWIEQNRENLRLGRRLRAECQEWQNNSRQEGMLLADAWLAAIAEWVDKTQPRLSALEREFLQKSLEKRDREVHAQLEQERRLRELAEARQKEAEAREIVEIEKSLEAEARAKAEAEKAEKERARAKEERRKTAAAMAAGVFAASSLGLGLLAQKLEEQAKLTEATNLGNLMAQAKQDFQKGDQLEALIASVRALKALKEIGGDQSKALAELQPVVYGARELNRIQAHEGVVRSLSFSSDGTIASAGEDGTVKLWAKDGTLKQPIRTGSPVYSVSFSQKENIIAFGSEDGTVKLWATNQTEPTTLKEKHKDRVWRVRFSPDGKTIASASYDGSIKLWAKNGTFPKEIPPRSKGTVYGVSFSPDGNTIASGSADGNIYLWTAKGEPLNKTKAYDNPVYDVSFSPDGQILASAGHGKSVKLWKKRGASWKDGIILWQELKDHEQEVYSVTFSRDGTIASGSADAHIRLWSKDGTRLESFNCRSFVNEVKFSPDGETVACATDAKTWLLWSVKPRAHTSSNLDEMLGDSCARLRDYLSANPKVKVEEPELCPQEPSHIPH
ncbi:nSTAND1 domain-containing NTPase [Kamptonema formosum]|uniref:nSTAND1 domain-containing NTPase n=1 Tax=Kamptonema formosum TaxID=331992 RepID=UPI000345DFDA|nr:caspase family protein [Oscillatoria sp. PCC 10802]